MNDKLIDNSSEILMMRNILKKCFSNEDITTVRIATGYWDIPGLSLLTEEIRRFLEKDGTKLLLLIGKDPYVYATQMAEGRQEKLKKFPQDYIRTDIQNLELKEEYIPAINLLLDYCGDSEDSKIQIKIFKTNEQNEVQFMHSKCYIFEGKDKDGSNIGYGIIGSSNFTQKGLEDNAELNYLVTSPYVVIHGGDENNKTHKQWFNEKWENSDPWSKEFLEQILKPAAITKRAIEKKEKEKQLAQNPFTPYELYIKLLQTKFGDIVNKDLSGIVESYLPQDYLKLNYQIDAVKQCFSIMKEHGGFMLADVVGLGKTIVGTLIIKHFLQFPNDEGREHLVLVVTPPAIKSAWLETIKQFDKDTEDKIADRIDFITTGSIGKLVDDFDEDAPDIDDGYDSGEFEGILKHNNYGLILIDESHKFRNSGTSMYRALDDLISQIGAEVGAYPYIGLLSATPQNNRPSDLQNQIYLFERNHSESTLKKAMGGNLEGFFSEMNRRYGRIIGSAYDDKESPIIIDPAKELDEISTSIRDCVLTDILVRRTRTDVQKYYHDDMEAQHMNFPLISGPHSLKYNMGTKLAQLFSNTMDIIAQRMGKELSNEEYLGYYRYRLIEFIKDPNYKTLYKGRNMDPDRFSQQLAHIMQINLVKRLESSFTAFKVSLDNLRRYTENMIKMWDNDTIFICPQIDVNTELNTRKHWFRKDKNGNPSKKVVSFDECVEDIRKKIKKLNDEDRNINGRNREYKRKDFSDGYITLLKKDLDLIDDLYKEWNKYPEDPKLDVFKRDLRPVLFDKTKNQSQQLVIFTEAIDTVETLVTAAENQGYRVLAITAKNRNEREQTIRENFDANYRGEWKNDYDIIVTTEVLAEGINLHRANTILNYDTPWNSTRLMQRIGRVNRIGSVAKYVYVYNFQPSPQGDEEIQLVNKAHTKLQSFHTLFGEDSKIFTENEKVSHYDLNTQVNGEESPLEKYVFELREYKKEHPDRYDFIAECNENLLQAIPAEENASYFLVKTPRFSGMFVKVDTDMKAHIISTKDMLDSFKPSTDAQSIDLPANWKEIEKEAVKKVNQELVRITIQAKNSQRATKAKGIILKMKDEPGVTEESRKILRSAFNLINKGNNDIIKRIIKLDEYLKKEQSENLLFHTTQTDIDNAIKRELLNIVDTVKRRVGEAQAFIGIYK